MSRKKELYSLHMKWSWKNPLKEIKFKIIVWTFLGWRCCLLTCRGSWPRDFNWLGDIWRSSAPYQCPVNTFKEWVLLYFCGSTFVRQSMLWLLDQQPPYEIPCRKTHNRWFWEPEGLPTTLNSVALFPEPFSSVLWSSWAIIFAVALVNSSVMFIVFIVHHVNA